MENVGNRLEDSGSVPEQIGLHLPLGSASQSGLKTGRGAFLFLFLHDERNIDQFP